MRGKYKIGIMDVIRKFSENKKEKSQKFKAMQEDDRLSEMLEARKLSSNERELIAYHKKKREENIKKQIDVIRKKRNEESWKSSNSILKSGKSILHEDTKILSNDRPILGQKNIFLDNKSHIPISKERLFFKW